MQKIRIPLSILRLALAVTLLCGRAWAGNNGYFTTYNAEVEQGEFELMLMTDLTTPSEFRKEEGFGDYLSHMVELEYGATDQWATELMVEWFEDLHAVDAEFTGFRWENRYRLFRQQVPLNPMVYAEYEDLAPETRYKMEVSGWVRPPYEEGEEEPDRERILETRLVLSEDVGPLDLAFNWINETDLASGRTPFGYSLGLMWMTHGEGTSRASENRSAVSGRAGVYSCPMHPEVTQAEPGSCPKCGMALVVSGESSMEHSCSCSLEMPGCGCSHCRGRGGKCPCAHSGMVGLGIELYGGLGDSKAFGLRPSRQEHYLGPILMYHLSSRSMFHTQLAIGLTKASDNLVRLNFGCEF